MANSFSTEAGKYLNNVPAQMASGGAHGGRMRRYRATITLASQADGDTVTLAKIPAGSFFAYGVLSGSATLGSSTIAIGVSGTAGKYRAAATHTATVPTMFGIATEVGNQTPVAVGGETVILTNTTAALPASGTLVVDLYYSAP